MKVRITLSNVIIHLALLLSALICIAPILNIIAISFSNTAVAATGKVFFVPKQPTLASYTKIIAEGTFLRSFVISVVRVVAAFLISMPVQVMMAYALSKDRKAYPERNVVMWITLFTMLFGGGLIPTYIVIKSYGLVNSFWALVLPMVMNVWNMIIMMNYFRSIPGELEEAAIMDGADAMKTLLKVYLPISLPMLATITLFLIVNHWNDFFLGLIYINDPRNFPIQTYIRGLSVQMDLSTITDPRLFAERLKVSAITFNAAKIVITMVPIICVYPFLQRYFVKGLVMGSVKE
ncbi:ABC transporter permease [Spirochaetia bacterium]|nr:ABC transporter permease [Spirochaetia bacterium]